MRLTLAPLERLLPEGLKVHSRDRLLFQRLSWGALAGCLATLLLAESPILESMELSMLEWHYRITNWTTSQWQKPTESKDITLVAFDDMSQFDLGIPNFKDQQAQELLAKTISKIESGNPAMVVVDLDLGNSSNPQLVKAMREFRNVVVALFGNLEGSSDLPAADYLKYAASYGYDELAHEQNGLVCRLPLSKSTDGSMENGIEQDAMASVPSISEAVIDLYRKIKGVGPTTQYLYSLSEQPLFISYQNVKFPTIRMGDVLDPEFNAKNFKDRIVMIGATPTQKHNDPTNRRTPFKESAHDLEVHAFAVETVLDNQVIYSCPRDIAHHLLLLIGAAFGAMASVLPMSRRVTVFLCTSMVLFVMSQIAFQLFHLNLPVASPTAVLFLGACLGTFIYLDTDLRQRNKELAEAREAMQVRAEEERQRIAEDLHDETLPALSSVARMADRLAQDLSDNPVPVQMREKLDFAVVEMRRVINDLHPSVLETMGFKAALENLAVMLTRETGIESNFSDGDGRTDYDLSNFTKLQLYRIVQEALNNVQKHSNAKLVEVSISAKRGNLIISVTDNGKGIDPRAIRKDSHGLVNIRQRAQLINALVEWRKPDKFPTGTELRLKITIEAENTGEVNEHINS